MSIADARTSASEHPSGNLVPFQISTRRISGFIQPDFFDPSGKLLLELAMNHARRFGGRKNLGNNPGDDGNHFGVFQFLAVSRDYCGLGRPRWAPPLASLASRPRLSANEV